jgi:hypothetical protein
VETLVLDLGQVLGSVYDPAELFVPVAGSDSLLVLAKRLLLAVRDLLAGADRLRMQDGLGLGLPKKHPAPRAVAVPLG